MFGVKWHHRTSAIFLYDALTVATSNFEAIAVLVVQWSSTILHFVSSYT